MTTQDTSIYTVVFKDYDGTVLSTQEVSAGNSAVAPEAPTRESYTFVGWDTDFNSVISDLIITALYNKISVYFGGIAIKNVCLGDIPVKALYLGEQLIFKN